MLIEQQETEYQEPAFLYTGRRRLVFAWINWTVGISAVLLQFSLQMSSGVLIDQISKSFSLTALNAGLLSGAYYYAYVLLQTPAGLLIDRFGARALITGGGFVVALGCWFFANAQQILTAEIGRLVMGMGGCFSFVGTIFLVSQWFPAKRFALMVGITETVALIGTIVGNIYVAKLVKYWGWRQSMMIVTIIAFTIAIASGILIRDRPYERVKHFQNSHVTFFSGFFHVARNTQCWLNGIYCGLLYSVLSVFVALWGVPFYSLKYGMDVTQSALVTTMVFAGAAFGCPFWGWVSERIQKRRVVLIWGALSSAILMSVVIYVHLPKPMLFICLFMLGVMCSTYVLNFVILGDILPRKYMSTGVGFTNGLCILAAPIFQPGVGLILSLMATGVGVGESQYYTTAQFHRALSLIPVALIIGLVVAFRIRETYTQKARPETP